MKRALVCCLLLCVLAAAGHARAALPTPAPLRRLIPSHLDAGEPFQLLFVTSQQRDALSGDIQQYNLFVNEVADAVGVGPQSAGVDWFAIGSTQAVDARDNAVVASPVYNLQGELVATGFADLWDGQLTHAVTYEEHGLPIIPFHHVWTGSRLDGSAHPGHELGAITTEIGDLKLSSSLWIEGTNGFPGIARHFYALSEPLLVSKVPEPASLAAGAIAFVGLSGARRRRCGA